MSVSPPNIPRNSPFSANQEVLNFTEGESLSFFNSLFKTSFINQLNQMRSQIRGRIIKLLVDAKAGCDGANGFLDVNSETGAYSCLTGNAAFERAQEVLADPDNFQSGLVNGANAFVDKISNLEGFDIEAVESGAMSILDLLYGDEIDLLSDTTADDTTSGMVSQTATTTLEPQDNNDVDLTGPNANPGADATLDLSIVLNSLDLEGDLSSAVDVASNAAENISGNVLDDVTSGETSSNADGSTTGEDADPTPTYSGGTGGDWVFKDGKWRQIGQVTNELGEPQIVWSGEVIFGPGKEGDIKTNEEFVVLNDEGKWEDGTYTSSVDYDYDPIVNTDDPTLIDYINTFIIKSDVVNPNNESSTTVTQDPVITTNGSATNNEVVTETKTPSFDIDDFVLDVPSDVVVESNDVVMESNDVSDSTTTTASTTNQDGDPSKGTFVLDVPGDVVVESNDSSPSTGNGDGPTETPTPTPNPAAGTVLRQICQGTTLMQTIADGQGGSYRKATENSIACVEGSNQSTSQTTGTGVGTGPGTGEGNGGGDGDVPITSQAKTPSSFQDFNFQIAYDPRDPLPNIIPASGMFNAPIPQPQRSQGMFSFVDQIKSDGSAFNSSQGLLKRLTGVA